MTQKILWIIPVLFLFITAPNAHADTFSYTVTGDDSGSLSITEAGGVINAISGTFDGDTITSLLAPGSIGANDNLYFTTPPIFDNDGVSFSIIDPLFGYLEVNLYSEGSAYSSEVGVPEEEFYLEADTTDYITPASSVPELNPTSGSSAIILLACAVLIIRGRRPLPTTVS